MSELQSRKYETTNQKHLIARSHCGNQMFFFNTNIIEHQDVAGVKSALLRVIENTKQIQDRKLLNTSKTAHKVFTELLVKKIITSTIEEI